MSITVSDLVGSIKPYAYNPMKIVSVAVTSAEKMFAGEVTLIDANNPFVMALELQGVHLSAFLTEARALTRALYPAAATTYADLYKHLSDTDYLNLFAIPASAKFTLMLELQQVLNFLVEDLATGVSQITIPRNSTFTAAGVTYSLQYPINIRKLQHGDIQVVYDASVVSPLRTLETNVIESWYSMTPSGTKYLCFDFEVDQFTINTSNTSVNATSGIITNIPLVDQFYYCRVYRQVSGAWVEMATTFTEQIYDSNVPTAVIKVADGVVTVSVPPVYTIGGSVRGKLRIDVYETKGPLNTYYGGLQTTDFSARWYYIDAADASAAAAAIKKITNLIIMSTDTAAGGRNALSFDDVRSRVIENAVGPRKTPITTAQATVALIDLGYTVVTNVDSVTNRRFIASRSLPKPSEVFTSVDNDVYTPANAHILTAVLRTTDAATLYGCVSHALGMTVTSEALFKTTNSLSSLLSNSAYASLLALPTQDRVDLINSGAYFFTPFYYVLEAGEDLFKVRPYALDWPSIKSRRFVKENATTGLQVSIGASYAFVKTSTGYRITIQTSSNDAYKAVSDAQVQAQLRVRCPDGSYAYLTTSPLSRSDPAAERTFVFNFQTNYEIDEANTLDLTNFSRTDSALARTTDLSCDFDVLFTSSATMPGTYVSSTIDSLLGTSYLNVGSVGLTQESLTMRFGDYLVDLWVDYRSFADSIEYQTWVNDVPMLYDRTVYARDPLTGASFHVVNDELVWDVLHAKGDPVLNNEGDPVYKARAGDFKLDQAGNPLPVPNYVSRLKRSVDFYVIDAGYRFATDSITVNYLAAAYVILLSQLTDDLPSINKQTLEETIVCYHPTITDGVIEAYIEKDTLVTMESAQSFAIVLYVPSKTMSNEVLKSSLRSTSIRLIGEHLAVSTTVAIDDVQTLLRTSFGQDVSSAKVSGLGGTNNYQVVTIKNPAARLSVQKNLVVKVNDLISLEEAIAVEFIAID